MKGIHLKHPTLEYPDGKIRVLDKHTKILYRYIDETGNYVVEDDPLVISYIMTGELPQALQPSS